jgi:hypothetical protein
MGEKRWLERYKEWLGGVFEDPGDNILWQIQSLTIGDFQIDNDFVESGPINSRFEILDL